MFIPDEVLSKLKETQKTFYCLNGHAQSYTKSTADILRDTVNKTQRELSQTKRELLAAKSEIYNMNHPPKRRARRV